MNPSLLILLYFLAVMRITRLINFDTIMDWLHNVVGNTFGPGSWQAEFLECPWCVGMWVSLTTAWVPLLFLRTPAIGYYVALYVLLALATSMVTGLMARFSSENTAMEERPQGDQLP